MEVSVCVMIVFVLSSVTCENILGLFPMGVKSHYVVFNSLMKELARRGHNITVISPFEEEGFVDNYTNINVNHTKMSIVNVVPFNAIQDFSPLFFFEMAKFQAFQIEFNGVLLADKGVNSIIFNTSYDLVFVELFGDGVFPLVANKLNIPVIGLSSGVSLPWMLSPFAVPQQPSYIPCFPVGFSKQMTIFEKILNVWFIITDHLTHQYYLDPYSKDLVEKQLGGHGVSVDGVTKNISMLFVYTHFTLHGARPFPPQVVEVGGLHLGPVHPLPQELDKWMNESTKGVIYFSFGSMLRGATLPTDKVKTFLEVFESLSQRVLWKWEDDTLENLPQNVKIMKWLPQRDILAHPNVKVFISHGGLLGTTEAVVSAVPILGIPMFGDQPNNVAALVENGVAIHVDYNNISVASLSYALNTLIYDKSYSQNAKELSRRFLDRPMSPLDTAVYWTEYVIRHKGAPHLQSAAVHLPWYQYYLLDVIGVLIAVLIVLLSIVYYTLKSCLRLVLPKQSTKLKRN